MSYLTIVAILTASLYVKCYAKEYVAIYDVELCLIIEYNIL